MSRDFSEMSADEIVEVMGWNADSMLELMSDFIRGQGMTVAYEAFLARRAREEEEG